MENYQYQPSYADSGDSSPRSREIDFENPPPWEDSHSHNSSSATLNYRVKFMCSYGGKIQPRPHDNQLSYTGGETKILSVDRGMKFGPLIAKLSSLCDNDHGVSFKYQLPGEDLDALISVTNEDDLEHMMHEYDRLFRASPKPARLRLFLFPGEGPRSFGSDLTNKTDKERFVEALNSGPIQTSAPPSTVALPPPVTQPSGNADFLFGLDKVTPQPTMQQQQQPPPPQQVVAPPAPVKQRDPESEVIGSESIQKHIQDLQRLRIEEQQQQQQQQQVIYQQRKPDENPNLSAAGGYAVGGGGDYYTHQKLPEKAAAPPPVNLPPASINPPPPSANFWPEQKQVAGGVFPATSYATEHQQHQPQPHQQHQPQPQQQHQPQPQQQHQPQPQQQLQPQPHQQHQPQPHQQHQPHPHQQHQPHQQQQVYMIPGPQANAYHGQMMRPMAGPAGQGYYTVHQRMPDQFYRDQQYNVAAQMGAPVQSVAAAPPTIHQQQPKMTAAYGGVAVTETGYPQMAYDGAGRQVYYAPQGVMGGPPQGHQYHQAMAAAASSGAVVGGVSGELKALNQEGGGGKVVVPKVTQNPL